MIRKCNKKIKGSFLFILSIFLAVVIYLPAAATTFRPSFDIVANAVCLYSLDSNTIIYEKNMKEHMYPASVTKIMTCILALENTKDLDAERCVYPNYVQDYLYTYQWVDGNGAVSLAGLKAGEELTMRQLLYALMLPSGNDAAMIIADHIAGSQEEFARMMTKRAKELGAENTNFVNASGLFDSEQVTTAYDLVQISLHAMKLPGFMEIVSTARYDSGPTNKRDNITWETSIKMQIEGNSYYYPGLKGIKTGSVPEAGDCVVTTCTRNGYSYLLVVLGSDYLDDQGNPLPKRGALVDTKNIYDWVFNGFKTKSIVDNGAIVGEVPLRLCAEQNRVRVVAGERFSAFVPVDTEQGDFSTKADLPDLMTAPIRKGDPVGVLHILLRNEELGTVPLLAADTLEPSASLVMRDKAKGILASFWFKFSLVLTLLIILSYALLAIRHKRRRRGESYRPKRRM